MTISLQLHHELFQWIGGTWEGKKSGRLTISWICSHPSCWAHAFPGEQFAVSRVLGMNLLGDMHCMHWRPQCLCVHLIADDYMHFPIKGDGKKPLRLISTVSSFRDKIYPSTSASFLI